MPTYFFKVIFLEDTRGVLTQKAYILPNRAFRAGESFKDFEEDLKDVEKWTGLSLKPVRR